MATASQACTFPRRPMCAGVAAAVHRRTRCTFHRNVTARSAPQGRQAVEERAQQPTALPDQQPPVGAEDAAQQPWRPWESLRSWLCSLFTGSGDTAEEPPPVLGGDLGATTDFRPTFSGDPSRLEARIVRADELELGCSRPIGPRDDSGTEGQRDAYNRRSVAGPDSFTAPVGSAAPEGNDAPTSSGRADSSSAGVDMYGDDPGTASAGHPLPLLFTAGSYLFGLDTIRKAFPRWAEGASWINLSGVDVELQIAGSLAGKLAGPYKLLLVKDRHFGLRLAGVWALAEDLHLVPGCVLWLQPLDSGDVELVDVTYPYIRLRGSGRDAAGVTPVPAKGPAQGLADSGSGIGAAAAAAPAAASSPTSQAADSAASDSDGSIGADVAARCILANVRLPAKPSGFSRIYIPKDQASQLMAGVGADVFTPGAKFPVLVATDADQAAEGSPAQAYSGCLVCSAQTSGRGSVRMDLTGLAPWLKSVNAAPGSMLQLAREPAEDRSLRFTVRLQADAQPAADSSDNGGATAAVADARGGKRAHRDGISGMGTSDAGSASTSRTPRASSGTGISGGYGSSESDADESGEDGDCSNSSSGPDVDSGSGGGGAAGVTGPFPPCTIVLTASMLRRQVVVVPSRRLAEWLGQEFVDALTEGAKAARSGKPSLPAMPVVLLEAPGGPAEQGEGVAGAVLVRYQRDFRIRHLVNPLRERYAATAGDGVQLGVVWEGGAVIALTARFVSRWELQPAAADSTHGDGVTASVERPEDAAAVAAQSPDPEAASPRLEAARRGRGRRHAAARPSEPPSTAEQRLAAEEPTLSAGAAPAPPMPSGKRRTQASAARGGRQGEHGDTAIGREPAMGPESVEGLEDADAAGVVGMEAQAPAARRRRRGPRRAGSAAAAAAGVAIYGLSLGLINKRRTWLTFPVLG